MDWFEKLNAYFPIVEMKSREHFELLFKDCSQIYKKDESDNHVLVFGEFDSFIFIDYILVLEASRGLGLGQKIMNDVKKKDKLIVLEVEPVRIDDPDTEKRIRFYMREGFQTTPSISYRRRCPVTNGLNEMDILYWSPVKQTEENIIEAMKKVYVSIHKFKDTQIYGKSLLDVSDVLTFKEKQLVN